MSIVPGRITALLSIACRILFAPHTVGRYIHDMAQPLLIFKFSEP